MVGVLTISPDTSNVQQGATFAPKVFVWVAR